jgi:very-short-patch-repair endonuclease
MELTSKLLSELQRRLKVGNRRGVHLNAIPANSRYKFDLNRLAHIDSKLPRNFIDSLLSEQPMKFRVSWKNNVPDLNSLFEDDQIQLVRITKSFENLINQTEAIEAEKGINTFGFGFPLLVRRDQADNKLTVAPVLIWSLRVRRTKEFNTWEILRTEDDPIYINEVLINHLSNDAKVEIEQIPLNMLEDGLLDRSELLDLCVKLIESINSTVPEDLRSTFSTKLPAPVSIGDKKHYEGLPLTSNNAFLEFGGLFSIFEVQKQNIIDDYDALIGLEGTGIELGDMENNVFQPLSSVDTDPSQQGILNSLSIKRNLLIQGPPGTGKSQTLTAILINALENNKKTIVVCEKRTALEVLQEALNKRGLEYHSVLIKDIVKDRKTVVDSVRGRIDQSSYRSYHYRVSKETLDQLIQHTSSLISEVNKKHLKLNKRLIGEYGWTDSVGLLLSELRKSSESEIELSGMEFVFDLQEMNQLVAMVQRGNKFYDAYRSFETLSFFNPARLIGENPYQVEQQINLDYKYYQSQLFKFNELISRYRDDYLELREAEFADQKGCLSKLLELKDNVAEFEAEVELFRSEHFLEQKTILENEVATTLKQISSIEVLISKNSVDPYFLDEKKTNNLFFKIGDLFSGKGKLIQQKRDEVWNALSMLESYVANAIYLEDFTFKRKLALMGAQLDSLKQNLDYTLKNHVELIGTSFELVNLLEDNGHSKTNVALVNLSKQLKLKLPGVVHHGELKIELSKHTAEMLNSCKDFNIFSTPLNSLSILASLDPKNMSSDFGIAVSNEFLKINLFSEKENIYKLAFQNEMLELARGLTERISSDAWIGEKPNNINHNVFLTDINKILDEKNNYFSHQQDVFTIEFNWFNFYNSLTTGQRQLINGLKKHNDWKNAFLIHYLGKLLSEAGTGDLPVGDSELRELKNNLEGFSTEQLRYVRQYWYSKQIDASRNFERENVDLSVENLYNKRSSTRFNRLSLRQIVQYDMDLFTTFFPIILTTPDVASNLFKDKNGYFDIVMFDEASQLRLEDNLPAILKGKQIIVAGDEHQMPPSNYFSKIYDGNVEDEEEIEEEEKVAVDRNNLLLSCESLLDFAAELNFEKKHLDFHYRSRHPFLIDFSNYAFYNQRLRPLPNSFEYNPIKYVQVGGTFSEHTNEAEAEMVINILEKNIHRLPDGKYPSVGIATFNITQRNLIKSKLVERQRFSKFQDFNDKIRELEDGGMFVKNLENIQGDERDVIIISTTYGVNKDGKFNQVFGPINFNSGYKLLNVIITRAKYKVYVCSSIPEKVFLNFKEHLTTLGANNKKAVFYAYLAYAKAVSEGNTELKAAVFSALAENTNVGRKLDDHNDRLESPFEEEVYRDLLHHFGEGKIIPQYEYAGFRIDMVYDGGIEGKPKVAIECDGARFHSSEEAYLHDLYRQRILEGQGYVFHRIWSTNWWRNPKRELNLLIEFIKGVETGEIAYNKPNAGMEDVFLHDVNFDSPNQSEFDFTRPVFDDECLSIENIELEKQDDNAVKIAINSQVKIRYVNTQKDMLIQIGNGSVIGGNVNIQKINIESPLAYVLLGAKVGDILKIGNLDNYVEVLDISMCQIN